MPGLTNASSPQVKEAVQLVVQANRILANEGILDAYGHVSLRHPDVPDHCLMACARSPELVDEGDIMEFGPDGEEVSGTGYRPYSERFIHMAVYEARPDVHAVCHNHALSFLPFTISKTLVLRPVLHTASIMGGPMPLWDIAEDFGPNTDLMVTNIEHGRSMTRTLADGAGVLLRAHGSTIVAANIRWLVGRCIEMSRSATVQLQAEAHGEIHDMTKGEIDAGIAFNLGPDLKRAWEYWCRRAGVANSVSEVGHQHGQAAAGH